VGIKLALVFFLLSAGMAGAGYWYYNDTQERIAILNENNAKLETAVQTNEQALEAQRASFAAMQIENERLNAQFKEISDRNRALENRLSRHDIGASMLAKPSLAEKVLNGGSANALRCIEIASGSPLTEKELSATKPSEINPECWRDANPNFNPNLQSEAWKRKNL
jgi:cell division protein FtsB|tara:strand:+ start:111 stop:608 length:498 start_codon:yes stop_codon:yes gene_type:complete